MPTKLSTAGRYLLHVRTWLHNVRFCLGHLLEWLAAFPWPRRMHCWHVVQGNPLKDCFCGATAPLDRSDQKMMQAVHRARLAGKMQEFLDGTFPEAWA